MAWEGDGGGRGNESDAMGLAQNATRVLQREYGQLVSLALDAVVFSILQTRHLDKSESILLKTSRNREQKVRSRLGAVRKIKWCISDAPS